VDKLIALLKEHNLKVTPQRAAILRILYDCKGHHLEIENIYALLVSRGDINIKRKIGLATVYRTMDLFERIGLVSKLSMEDSPARYELIIKERIRHHHLICLGCDQVQEIEDGLMEDLKTRILREKGFEITDKPMKIYGYCHRCRRTKQI